MLQRIDRDASKQFTPQVNNAKLTKTNLTLHKNVLFKYTVTLTPHSLFCILSHLITPYSASNGSNSTGQQGTINRTLKRFLITISITKNDNTAIAVGKAVNMWMKVIHGIEVDANKVKIFP